MKRLSYLIPTVAFFVVAGCTGESVRVVLPGTHPANPSAAEAPFVLPPDPFTAEPPTPPPAEKPAGHRHGDQHGSTDDEMRMDDMRMDDNEGGGMMHGDHGKPGTEEKEGEK